LGPIVPQSNPVRVAEELAMLDTLAQGRLVVGLAFTEVVVDFLERHEAFVISRTETLIHP
ncbi:MAG: hypothetical protein ACREKB_03090, partial [Candidatus Rokuibacteriota bacterium]